MAANRVIGAGGRIPWHYTSDMRHVKETTTGFPCIMGRKTYESFPRRPLPGRQNIVLTRSTGYQVAAEVKICAGLAEATTWCGNLGAEKVFILGGEEVYRLALAEADEMLITLVPDDVAGDTLFLQGCGRLDLPTANVDEMWRTLYERLATLPGDVVLYPGHDYGHLPSAPLADVRRFNSHLKVPDIDTWRRLMGR